MKEQRVDHRRVTILRVGENPPGPVIYWMSRDQRIHDNWALLYAQDMAIELRRPLIVLFCIAPSFLNATRRQYSFMLRAFESLEHSCRELRIGFRILSGEPAELIPAELSRIGCALLVTDFDPIRIKQCWRDAVMVGTSCPVHEVDAHNIVPCRIVSNKREYAARTIRPKINRLLPEFLVEFPKMEIHPYPSGLDDASIKMDTQIPGSVPADFVESHLPETGPEAASCSLTRFIEVNLDRYADKNNSPLADVTSHLSPHIHFGQIAAQRIALMVSESREPGHSGVETYLEQLIVRRELSDNFCHHCRDYESLSCIPDWAKKTLNDHCEDPRSYFYTPIELEEGATHDAIWNAAQMEMVHSGSMHGYLRMYWAKKILEWTQIPEEALEIAIYLNDKYQLDGRDPNGYVGILWCIGGLHDRAWGERQVFGKIRYMSYTGCARKFDHLQYIQRVGDFGWLS